MSNNKMIAIADKLLERTRQGQIAWESTSSEDRYFIAFPDYSISISRDPWGPIRTKYVLSVRGKAGTEIDSLRGNEYQEVSFEKLQELFEAARHSAMRSEGVDEILDEILERLSKQDMPAQS